MFCYISSYQFWDVFVFNCIYDIGINFVSVKSGYLMWYVSLDDIVVIFKKVLGGFCVFFLFFIIFVILLLGVNIECFLVFL